ncbi:CPBP family intramembrane glutamic endopeptidase [Clostridium mediterraneense]|uniref:CPBP family intramembrane glutamic endopeptidase n=1 Tax=Clostridium mediterraneense TaxID=1805472 RepID=UPI0008360C24|nr:type II CAAX endopeptidase family protein [Clostridium mediterraneense]
MSLKEFNIFKRIQDGNIYVRPFNILMATLIIIIYYILINLFSGLSVYLINSLNIQNTSLIQLTLFFLKFFFAILTLLMILSFIKDTDYKSNYYGTFSLIDCFYILIFIIGFRLFFEGSFVQILNYVPKLSIFSSFFTNFDLGLILYTCIYSPLLEEVLFRGIILNSFIKKYSSSIALIFSSLVFAIAHLNFIQGINAFFLALILGYIYLKTKSLYLCIALHFFNNILASIMPSFIFSSLSESLFYILVNLLAGILFMYFAYKKLNLPNRETLYFNKEE